MEGGREVMEEWMCVSKVAVLLPWKDVVAGQTTHARTHKHRHTRKLTPVRPRQTSRSCYCNVVVGIKLWVFTMVGP